MKRLYDFDVEFIVIGGVAAALHGSPESTFDVDVCAPLHDKNIERIVEALRGLHPHWRFRPDRVFPIDDARRFSGFKNLYIRTDWGDLDVLGELPPIGEYRDITENAVEFDLEGFKCRVIDFDALLLIKRSTGREKDKLAVMHLEALKKSADKVSNPPGSEVREQKDLT